MSQKLTRDQREEYLSKMPPECPWCYGKSLSAGPLTVNADEKLRSVVKCKSCQESWFEVYVRQDIEDGICLKLYLES